MESKVKRNPRDRASIIGLGIVIGVGIGAALNNVGIGVALGVALGAAIEMFASRKQDNDNDSA